jgi:hypothetical protein
LKSLKKKSSKFGEDGIALAFPLGADFGLTWVIFGNGIFLTPRPKTDTLCTLLAVSQKIGDIPWPKCIP